MYVTAHPLTIKVFALTPPPTVNLSRSTRNDISDDQINPLNNRFVSVSAP